MPKRTIVIGDIHGCARALHTLLKTIQPGWDDTLITLGDYVDRGPDSAGVIEQLCGLVGECNLVPLLGNHEVMMLHARQGKSQSFWYECGGDATIESYGGNIANMPQHHQVFFENCRKYYETETDFFIHANYDQDVALEDQDENVMFWQHVNHQLPPPHVNGKRAFVGHTPQQDGEVKVKDHIVLMDTYCYGGMWLSAYEIETGNIWQANEMGELRE